MGETSFRREGRKAALDRKFLKQLSSISGIAVKKT
jgi:hypothetical protein